MPFGVPEDDWREMLLDKGGYPETTTNFTALALWAQSEGIPPQYNNPLAASDKVSGTIGLIPGTSIPIFNSITVAVNLYAFKFTTGIYIKIHDAFKRGDSMKAIYSAIHDSLWCHNCWQDKKNHSEPDYPVAMYNYIHAGFAPTARPNRPGKGYVYPSKPPVPVPKNAWKGWNELMVQMFRILPEELIKANKYRQIYRRAVR